MSLNNSPSIVTSGLTFYYDMNNPNSYFGPPLTNILPNGVNAGYPTYPSGWGTYNVNQYNGGVYFSIGTISSVVSNVVTTATNHPLRTYDVVTPQTTGGGVTAGTNYLVKKLSDTTFSLFAYNSTQDAYDIFTTAHNSIDTNTTVSINSTSFPTMWWGPPHLPNSGIMKQIVRNGFNWEGRVHDCLRIHWYRPDGVKDGMAYGNEPTVTSGLTYTVNFYHRAATPNCVGSTVQFQRWTNGDQAAVNFTLGSTWQKFTYTWVPTQSGLTYFYWFDVNTPTRSSWDISEIMFYQGSGSSEYVASNVTRANTASVLDLTKTYVLTTNGITYNSDNTFSFPGTSSGNIDLNTQSLITGTNPFTIESWTNKTAGNYGAILTNYGSGYTSGLWWSTAGLYISGSVYHADYVNSMAGIHHSAVTRDSSGNVTLYKDGVLSNTGVLTGAIPANINWRIGGDVNGGGEALTGSIYNLKTYNRVLSSAEISQNFNALRGRYGI